MLEFEFGLNRLQRLPFTQNYNELKPIDLYDPTKLFTSLDNSFLVAFHPFYCRL